MVAIDAVESDMNGLRFRCIGPVRGGRVLAVAGHPTEKQTFYFGACAGGIWKTTDGGVFWATRRSFAVSVYRPPFPNCFT